MYLHDNNNDKIDDNINKHYIKGHEQGDEHDFCCDGFAADKQMT